MFETAAYHRGLQWPGAPSACGYTVPTFDTPSSSTSSSKLSSPAIRDIPHWQSAAEYHPGLADHGRYSGAPGPLYDGRSVRDVLFGCGRFSDPGATSSTIQTAIGDGSLQPSSVAAFSPLSLSCVGQTGAATSTGAVAECPPPRLPATPYGYSSAAVTATGERYYGGGVGGGAVTFSRDVQTAECATQPTTGFRAPALGLGFNPRRLMNDVIGEYFD